jgi:hypothetical protein
MESVMSENKKRLLAAVVGLGLVVALNSVAPVRATVISANFTDSAVTGVQTLAAGATAGAVASSHWQNVDVSPAAGSSLNVLLSDGSGGSAQMSCASSGLALNGLTNVYFGNNNGSWGATSGLTPTQALFNNYIQASRNNAFTIELSLTNITYPSYSIYVYDLAQNSWNDAGSAQIFYGGKASGAGPTYYMKDSAAWGPWDNLPTTYTQATATSLAASTSGANYFLFSGLSGPTQAIDILAGLGTSNDFGSISGIQIVATTPEPASLSLLALGGLLVLPRRRHA